MSKSKRDTLTISYHTKDRIWIETLYVIKKPSTNTFFIFDFYQIKTPGSKDIVVRKKVSLKFMKRCDSVYDRYGVNKIYFFAGETTTDKLIIRVFGDYIKEIDEDTINKVYEFLKKQLKSIKTAEKWNIIKKLFKRNEK